MAVTFRNWEQKMTVPLTRQLLTLTITLSIIRDVMDGVKTCNNELRVQHYIIDYLVKRILHG
mgnify:CR=1 FL=1